MTHRLATFISTLLLSHRAALCSTEQLYMLLAATIHHKLDLGLWLANTTTGRLFSLAVWNYTCFSFSYLASPFTTHPRGMPTRVLLLLKAPKQVPCKIWEQTLMCNINRDPAPSSCSQARIARAILQTIPFNQQPVKNSFHALQLLN